MLSAVMVWSVMVLVLVGGWLVGFRPVILPVAPPFYPTIFRTQQLFSSFVHFFLHAGIFALLSPYADHHQTPKTAHTPPRISPHWQAADRANDQPTSRPSRGPRASGRVGRGQSGVAGRCD